MLPASKSRAETTGGVSQVGAFRLGKGRFDLLIRERRAHLLQTLMVNERGRQERRMRALGVATSSALSVESLRNPV